jgi:nucleotide-binding universal stress UspA family protein
VQPPVLICYDGSDGARAALEVACRAFAGRFVVACYWQPFAGDSRPLAVDMLQIVQDPDSINERERALAEAAAEEGAQLARSAGHAVEAVAVEVSAPIDQAILAHADELDAVAIVLGSRSRSGLGSLLLGDTAGDVVQLASRPVFVVPSNQLAENRRENRRRGVAG